MIGCVGDDDFGRVNLNRLRRDGVDVSGIRIDAEAVTGAPSSDTGPTDRAPSSSTSSRAPRGGSSSTPPLAAVLDRSDHLHVMGTALFSARIVDIVLQAAQAVKTRGGTISFDPNLRPEMLTLPGLREACEELFRRCDVFLPSGSELTLFTSAKEDTSGRRGNPRGARPCSRPQAGRRGRTLLRSPDSRGRSRGSRSKRSIPPAPATASARPSSVAGCATCRRPIASPTPPRAGPWRSRDRDRWKARRAGRNSTPFWRRIPGDLRDEPPVAVTGEGASDRRRRRRDIGLLGASDGDRGGAGVRRARGTSGF